MSQGKPNPLIQCSICNRSFTLNKSLYRHLREKHDKVWSEDPAVQKETDCQELCALCGCTFSTRQSLKQHLINIHHEDAEGLLNSRLICPSTGCDQTFLTQRLLRSHLT